MIKHYLNAVQNNYVNFSGRARRSEYWYFILCYYIIAILAVVIDNTLGLANDLTGYGFITLAVMLGHLLPSLSLVVRRLHDVGKSGWFYLIAFIPIIGGIWLLVLFCTEGTRGENQYGVDPKE
tara:strand:+ start:250 stop:618 length:369 start_codon:yes stop_codon:yes gene_type:complete